MSGVWRKTKNNHTFFFSNSRKLALKVHHPEACTVAVSLSMCVPALFSSLSLIQVVLVVKTMDVQCLIIRPRCPIS